MPLDSVDLKCRGELIEAARIVSRVQVCLMENKLDSLKLNELLADAVVTIGQALGEFSA